jgi:hypothetical protein
LRLVVFKFKLYTEMRMKNFLLLFLLSVTASAQIRKYSNDFLEIGVGAQSLGTGNSVIATARGVQAAYWNPAGLSRPGKANMEAALMHSEYFAGLSKYDYAAFSKTIDSTSSFAISAIRLAVDDIPNTLDLIDANGAIDYSRVTRFSAADYGFLFSYGKRLKIKGLSLGGSAKIIHRKVGSFAKANGFGIDFGLQYQKGAWHFGLMAKDVTTTFNAWTFNLTEKEKQQLIITGNDIPKNSIELTEPKLILAAAYKYNHNKLSILAEGNFINTFFGQRNSIISSEHWNLDPRVGLQIGYAETIWLRGGIGNIQQTIQENNIKQQVIQPNIGAGFKIPIKNYTNVYVDYAFANVGQQVGLLSHIFSLRAEIFKQ